MGSDQNKRRRADFLDGCGALSLGELREWARELTPHPAVSLPDWNPETPLHVALLFPEVDPAAPNEGDV